MCSGSEVEARHAQSTSPGPEVKKASRGVASVAEHLFPVVVVALARHRGMLNGHVTREVMKRNSQFRNERVKADDTFPSSFS